MTTVSILAEIPEESAVHLILCPDQVLIDRFWSKVDVTNDIEACWNWIGNKDHKGYGQFSVGPQRYRKMMSAHRVAYTLVHGVYPNEKLVLHHCDNPSCVSPFHLFLGTYKDNHQDMWRKGRSRYQLGKDPICHRPGASSPVAKLSEKQAIQILLRRNVKREKTKDIAKDYGISDRQVSGIALGQTWKHLLPQVTALTQKAKEYGVEL